MSRSFEIVIETVVSEGGVKRCPSVACTISSRTHAKSTTEIVDSASELTEQHRGNSSVSRPGLWRWASKRRRAGRCRTGPAYDLVIAVAGGTAAYQEVSGRLASWQTSSGMTVHLAKAGSSGRSAG